MNMRKTFAMACGIAATTTQAIELENQAQFFKGFIYSVIEAQQNINAELTEQVENCQVENQALQD